jgi:cell division protein FtsN
MPRDPRALSARGRLPAGRTRGGTLLGILIGLVLGLAVASVVAFVLMRSPNPFQGVTRPDTPKPAPSVAPELTLPGGRPSAPAGAAAPGDAAKAPEKPRFDFYKILPGTEEAKPRSEKASEEPRASPEARGGAFYLQAGAFTSPADAEDQKAKLALLGWEATIAVVKVPERGTVHRVRVGPFRTADEMNQAKGELARSGFATAVIKNP